MGAVDTARLTQRTVRVNGQLRVCTVVPAIPGGDGRAAGRAGAGCVAVSGALGRQKGNTGLG